MQTPQLNPENENNVVHFFPLRDSEFIFQKSLEALTAQGIRSDIANSLASYAAFQGEAFDPHSSILIHLHEEIGQEPQIKGRLAA